MLGIINEFLVIRRLMVIGTRSNSALEADDLGTAYWFMVSRWALAPVAACGEATKPGPAPDGSLNPQSPLERGGEATKSEHTGPRRVFKFRSLATQKRKIQKLTPDRTLGICECKDCPKNVQQPKHPLFWCNACILSNACILT